MGVGLIQLSVERSEYNLNYGVSHLGTLHYLEPVRSYQSSVEQERARSELDGQRVYPDGNANRGLPLHLAQPNRKSFR